MSVILRMIGVVPPRRPLVAEGELRQEREEEAREDRQGRQKQPRHAADREQGHVPWHTNCNCLG